ncbi:MAG: HAD-IB family phosphatase [Opitutales bacterium]|nr:HAD-IB family phosphatase [Opitutales bacterium]MCH8539985.1 HAD-IB family phosphatase [Opitutales bacterium]
MKKTIVFDCDSTLSSIEGVDELARLKGESVYREIEAMTNAAMNGEIAVEEVFAKRLALLNPSRDDIAEVGLLYIREMVPGLKQALEQLRKDDWGFVILSGGFREAILPLARELGIARVEAVDLRFDAAGNYRGFDEAYPTTRTGGKPEVLQRLKEECPETSYWVMVGDGVSDLETKPEVDLFLGYGGVVEREKVKAGADAYLTRMEDLPSLLKKMSASGTKS